MSRLHHFRGVSLPNSDITISHLMYAYDVTFIDERLEINFSMFLPCFGVKEFFGVDVNNLEIDRMASILKCEPASFPFTYLGLPTLMVEKFRTKLSKWKAKSLSFGGRLTLVNSVLNSLPLYYFSLFRAPRKIINLLDSIRRRFLWGGDDDKKKINWVAWDMVNKPKDNGGLEVGCLDSANLALLAKWWWRLKGEIDSVWFTCIQSIHNLNLIDGKPLAKYSLKGVWYYISHIAIELEDKGIFLSNLFKRVVDIGDKTYFWKDVWCDDYALKDIYPNLYALEKKNKDCLANDWMNLGDDLVPGMESTSEKRCCDRWQWTGDSKNNFSVKALRQLIDRSSKSHDNLMRWVNWIPLKDQLLFKNRIPTFCNLIKLAIGISSSLCAFCRSCVESIDHTFFSCSFVTSLYKWMVEWSGIVRDQPFSCISLMYMACNGIVFINEGRSLMLLVDDISINTFNWIKNMSKFCNTDWSL
uniref:Reverse transcriptase zinc-binding domain-containing protein n=1 Tax=Lactuca sativa TaxID=4236 RepID=A0A9R1VX28_LACSA|nr:hypothetical protein LSAT_V11C400187120 [Lactuca sativa]